MDVAVAAAVACTRGRGGARLQRRLLRVVRLEAWPRLRGGPGTQGARERGRGGGGDAGPREGGEKGNCFFLFNVFSNLCFSSSSSPKCILHQFTQQTK
jgi:hypothetical protein